jgi:acetyltransferase
VEQFNYFEKLFYPKSIAFIGATPRRTWQLRGILGRDFEGQIYLVSKGNDEILGHKCVKDIADLPDGIDHAIIGINRKILVEIVEKCIEKKFHTIHIFSAGTGEFDEMGLEIENKLYELIKNNDIRAIGPNCMGIYSTGGRFSYSPYFKAEPIGNVSFVSQSGDLTDRTVETLNDLGVNFATAASIGNSISLTISDFIEYYNWDRGTEIIGTYFEGFSRYKKKQGRRLFEVLKKNKKPIIMLRSGRTVQGKRSATSHTGTLTSDKEIWNAVYSQTGVIPVETLDELTDTIQAFYYYKNTLPKVNGVILITWSGGTATVSTDNLAQLGVNVPEIQDPAMSKMKELINIGSTLNPLDLPWVSGSETYTKIIKTALDEPYIGGMFLETFAPSDDSDWGRGDDYYTRLEKLKEYCDKIGKLFFISLPHANPVKREGVKQRFLKMNIPIFPSFERAAQAYLNMYKFSKFIRKGSS